ncbi:MAG: rod shape-determining protein [Chromatiales bacterium]|nr:rod shape-determining protein [Chromatiales bacterium]
MLKKIFSLFSDDLSIDLGTANTLICMKGRGIVLNEPSVVATRITNNGSTISVEAAGHPAKEMMGKTPSNIKVIRPLKDGVIADFTTTEKMLQIFIHKVYEDRFLKSGGRALICVPCGATQVERRAIRESALGAGVSKVYLIEEPIAAAIGANLPISQAQGSMLLDIGGGTSEVAVLSLNGIVYSASVRFGGDRLDEAIINYLRKHYNVLIGEATAERVKSLIGTAYPTSQESKTKINAREVAGGLPRNITVSDNEIHEAMKPTLDNIVTAVKKALDETPPELSSDIAERGIVLTGGGALLRNLDVLISNETSIPVILADEPLNCVAQGGGKALELLDEKKITFLYEE